MPSYIKQSKRSIGFGVSMNEALEDAYVNSCIGDISMDTKGIFIKRREQICPWMPKSNMLHLSGIGCLVYDKGKITETRTGKQVLVAATRDSVFYYLSTLFGDRLSYSDIVCVLRNELDTFFTNISKEFIPITDLPLIQVQQEDSFRPVSVYYTTFNFMIGYSDDAVGVRWTGDDCYYTINVDDSTQQLPALYRLLYRGGYTIVDGDLVALDEAAYTYD